MFVIYVAGPFRGANDWERHQNINRTEETAFNVWEAGAAALCPHNNTRHFDGALPDDIWLKGDLELLKRCDGMILSPGWARSQGVAAEIQFAVDHEIPVFYSMLEFHRWLGQKSQEEIARG